ncbi:MAG: hypothetical protein AAB726_03780 [Patescibacteria group bacterium]
MQEKLKKISKIFVLTTFFLLLSLAPLISSAQAYAPLCPENPPGSIREFQDLVCLFLDLINTVIPVVIALMLLVFFYGLAKFVFRVGGDEGAIEEGKQIMLWGIIGLFVAVSIYGILQFFYSDLVGGRLNIPPQLPIFPQS